MWLRVVLLALGCLPFVGALAARFQSTAPLAGALDTLFALQCHRAPARMLEGIALPVCARCAGLYLGLAIAAIVPGPARRARRLWLLFAIGAAACLLDAAAEAAGATYAGSWRRAFFGCVVACAAARLLMLATRQSGAKPSSPSETGSLGL
ncbi:MAG: DUF2085 domain-containing protein [Polyangiaceae bacterium]|nr:DUF2085 domain-containing protein [Polyangiaceae bacterium]